MFEDSLIESGGKLKTKRGRTSFIAFLIEFMIIGVMVLIPLIFTEALPKGQMMFLLVAPPPPPPPPPPAAAVVHVKQIQTDIVNGELRTPTKIPQKIKMIQEDEAPPAMATTGVVGGVPGGVPGGSMEARIQGVVVLQAQISKEGNIENLQLISGHPMLAPAAIEAVKQWKYRPYLLNGEPVEVDTQVQVNFTLAGG